MRLERPAAAENEPEESALPSLFEKFAALGHSEFAHVQVSSTTEQWFRDSTAYKPAYDDGKISFAVTNDSGVMERYESIDETGENFRNTVTGEIEKLRISFPSG